MSAPDHRDLVIEALADSEARLLGRVAWMTADRDTWRSFTQAAIHQLHDEAGQRRALGAQYARLLDEYRQFRAQTMGQRLAA